MKKIAFIIIASIIGSPVLADYYGSNNTHDMQIINQQRFRFQELNDMKDLQEQKVEHQKKMEQAEINDSSVFHKLINHKKETKFTEENGEIKIKYEE